MKYTIKLGGRGGELYIHRINEDQIRVFKENDVNEQSMEIDEVLTILKKDNADQSEESFIGPYYLDGVCTLEVYNEKEGMVWSHYSDDDGSWEYDAELVDEIDECGDIEFYADDVLLAEVKCNGIFREYSLELEGEFDPNLLTPKIMEVIQRFAVITELYYDKQKLQVSEWGDPETKGVYFYLSDEMLY